MIAERNGEIPSRCRRAILRNCCAAVGRGFGSAVRQAAVGLLIAVLGSVSAANAAEPRSATAIPDQLISFDIPSGPVEDALYQFGAVTGIEVVADGNALGGRRSAAVKGLLTAAQALQLLLTGSGLSAHAIGVRAITLSIDRKQASDAAAFRNYSAILQQAALRRLCEMRETRLGSFRLAMQLWLDEAGSVARVELLSSTGDQAHDGQIRRLLTGLTVARPPSELPQPVVMVILPRAPADNGDCIGSPSWPTAP